MRASWLHVAWRYPIAFAQVGICTTSAREHIASIADKSLTVWKIEGPTAAHVTGQMHQSMIWQGRAAGDQRRN